MTNLFKWTICINFIIDELVVREDNGDYTIRWAGNEFLVICQDGTLDKCVIPRDTGLEANSKNIVKSINNYCVKTSVSRHLGSFLATINNHLLPINIGMSCFGDIIFYCDQDKYLFTVTEGGRIYREKGLDKMKNMSSIFQLNKEKQIRWSD